MSSQAPLNMSLNMGMVMSTMKLPDKTDAAQPRTSLLKALGIPMDKIKQFRPSAFEDVNNNGGISLGMDNSIAVNNQVSRIEELTKIKGAQYERSHSDSSDDEKKKKKKKKNKKKSKIKRVKDDVIEEF